MAQKVNPVSLRLQKTNREFDSCWFNESNYVNLLMKDIKIQSYINLVLKQTNNSSARYLIQNLPNKIKIIIFFSNTNKKDTANKTISILLNKKKTPHLHSHFSREKKHTFLNQKSLNLNLNINSNSNSNSNSPRHLKHRSNFKFNTLFFKKTQNKTFQYVMKNVFFNMDSSCNIIHNNLKQPYNPNSAFALTKNSKNLVENKNNVNFNNNDIVNVCIKKLNEFYIRYFIIKYFYSKNSTKFAKTVSQLQHKQNFFILCNINFLFLIIFKIKKFTLLDYLKTKVNTYKTLIENKQKTFSNLYEFCVRKNTSYKHNVFPSEKNNVKFTGLTLLNEKKSILKFQLLYYLKAMQFNLMEKPDLDTIKDKFKMFAKNTNLHNEITNLHHEISVCVSSETRFNVTAKACYMFFLMKHFETLQFSRRSYGFVHEKNKNTNLLNTLHVNSLYHNYCKLSFKDKYYKSIFPDVYKENYKYTECATLKNSNLNIENYLYDFHKFNAVKNIVLHNSPYKNHVESVISTSLMRNVSVNFFKTTNIFHNAIFLVDEIVSCIEKRIPFFKIKTYILRKLTTQKSFHVKGLRVTVSGRVGGKSKKAQRSKIQSFKYGETCLNVFSKKIDFSAKNAFTLFGTLGVKVWICYN